MRKFRFGLEALISQRVRDRDRAQGEYAKSQRQLQSTLDEIKNLYASIDESRQWIKDQEDSSTSQVESITQAHSFIKLTYLRIEKLRERARIEMQDLNQKEEVLQKAQLVLKQIEKIREKRFNEYKETLEKRELRDYDDLVTSRFSFKED